MKDVVVVRVCGGEGFTTSRTTSRDSRCWRLFECSLAAVGGGEGVQPLLLGDWHGSRLLRVEEKRWTAADGGGRWMRLWCLWRRCTMREGESRKNYAIPM